MIRLIKNVTKIRLTVYLFLAICCIMLGVFKSKAECQAAREERYSRANGSSSGNIDLDSGIPADVVATAKGLIQAVGLKQAEGILSTTPPYNAYDTEELIQAANSL